MPDTSTPIVHHHQLGNGRHALETVAHFPLPVEAVFPFFCDVQNLERITPPELAFRVRTPGPVAIGLDTLVDYRLGLFGIPFGWRSTCASRDATASAAAFSSMARWFTLVAVRVDSSPNIAA